MMEEQDKVEPEYLKGFNEGYDIARHKPELAEKLAAIDSDFIRLVGFKDGKKQYEAERAKTRLPSWMKEDRFGGQKDVPGKTKDKDRDIEPEK
ncbi:hypothetical protein [Spirosoma pulveris]